MQRCFFLMIDDYQMNILNEDLKKRVINLKKEVFPSFFTDERLKFINSRQINLQQVSEDIDLIYDWKLFYEIEQSKSRKLDF